VSTLAHISDLHFGRTHERIVQHLHDDLMKHRPDVVVVSGDLTQRARRHELLAARAFLDSLPFARVVVPGNHDVAPLSAPIERALDPWRRFHRVISESTATVHTDDGVTVIGINTVDPWRFVEGGVTRHELARVLVEARKPATFRVLAAHHPLIETALRPLRNKIRRHRSLDDTFEHARIDLVLTGHLHDAFSGPAAARVEGRHAVLAVQASTATSTRLRGHKNAWNFITIDPQRERVHVRVRISDGDAFTTGAEADWIRRDGAWHAHVERGSDLVETVEGAPAL
jgi:3',5'-cyclic AMP phosphodiesterase CpdA